MKFLNLRSAKQLFRLLFCTFISLVLVQKQGKAQCLNVDLQAVSIDPTSPNVNIGQTIQIVAVLRNNGPCPIPTGEAQVTITFSSTYLSPGAPLNFTDGCVPARWTYLTNVPTPGLHNLFFRNTLGPIPVGGASCAFSFNVTGVTGTPSPTPVTLVSTLTATATTADVDGRNQSSGTFVNVVGAPDLTSSQFFSQLQIAPGQVIDEVIAIRNVGTGATSAPIVFGITNYTALTGLTVTSNPAASVTIGIDNYTLDNANWTFNSITGQFTSNVGVVIPAGGTRNIGIRITRGTNPNQGANGTVTQTTSIVNGTGGGETPTSNNSISNSILKI